MKSKTEEKQKIENLKLLLKYILGYYELYDVDSDEKITNEILLGETSWNLQSDLNEIILEVGI